MLRELNLLPVYDSSEYDLIKNLQVPLLQHSSDYLRGVGFFSSGWLQIASRGMADFVEHGGKARLVLSPILDQRDWEALQLGEEARFDDALKSVLTQRVSDLQSSLATDTLNALAWMIADKVLDIRFAVPRAMDCPGIYHDKVGIYTDDNGDSVALHGSLNDSIQGSLNGEAYSVFKSWGIPHTRGGEPHLNSCKLFKSKAHKKMAQIYWAMGKQMIYQLVERNN